MRRAPLSGDPLALSTTPFPLPGETTSRESPSYPHVVPVETKGSGIELIQPGDRKK